MPEVAVQSLPPVKVLATGQPIVASAEKAQISSISVETGKPGTKSHKSTLIYEGKDFVDGLHPTQGRFLLNLIIGGLGGGRGDRPTAFASWCVEVAKQFESLPSLKSLEKYNVVIDYNNRGGTVVYPVEDLLTICEIRTRNTEISHERFPPDRKAPARKRDKEPKTVKVSLTL